MPHFPLMHEMTTDHVHEEIQLLANDFSTMLFETLADVPALARLLPRPTTRPRITEHLRHATQGPAVPSRRPALAAEVAAAPRAAAGARIDVFPGVIVVFTHRDPVPVVLSMIAMITYSARMHRSPVPVRTDRRVLGRPPRAHARRDRAATGTSSAGPLGRHPLRRVHGGRTRRRRAGVRLAGEPLTEAARVAIADYLAGHQRGRLGSVATSVEMFGLDERDLPDRFARYRERFLS